MAPAPSIDTYEDALVFLVTAGIVVPLFRRLRLSPVIGFLLAGALIGPFGVGRYVPRWPWLDYFRITSLENMAPLAELGVVFLLFMIGLELSFERLRLMRRLVFGLGALQVGAIALAIGFASEALGANYRLAAVIGGALALSSTAVVMPVLAETKRLNHPAGRAAFAVLLFQDLMVAPLLIMVALLGRSDMPLGLGIISALAPAALALALLVLMGRLALRPLFHLVVLAGSTEFFVAACLLVVLAMSLIASLSGLSMGLGAFVAGLLLAETEYRREIEVTVEPFKGLLLGLFFVSVGAGLDLWRVVASPLTTIGIAAALVAGKALLLFGLARAMRLTARVSAETALLLAAGGEFAFVMIGAAMAEKIVPPALGADLMIAITLSMLAIPVLAALARRFDLPRIAEANADEPAPPQDAASRVIVVGYGRVGQLVCDMLTRHKIAFLAIDNDVEVVRKARQDGAPIYWGNASRPEFLRRCGIEQALALVVTSNAPSKVDEIVGASRLERADLVIVARARDAAHATRLYEIGASDAIPETIEASLQLSEAVLVDIGVPMGFVIASIHEKRDEYRALLQPQAGERERKAIRGKKGRRE